VAPIGILSAERDGSVSGPSSEVQRLVAAERAARIAGESAAQWWRQLTAAADSAVTPESLDSLFREALVTVRDALEADSVALLLADASENELVARASAGLSEEVTIGVKIHSGEGMAGRVMASRQPLIVPDLSKIHVVSPVLRESGLRSVVAVPIMSGDRLLGVLHAGSRRLDRFGPLDAQLLELLADRLALALDRVRLFDEQVRLARLCSFFAQAAQVIAESSDLADALARLADLALGVLGDVCLIDVLDNDGRLERLVAKHRDPSQTALTQRLQREFPPDPQGDHPAVRVLRTGELSWSPTMSDEFLRATSRDAEHLAVIQGLGFRSYITVPIASKGEILGSLTVVSCTRSFQADDVEFARDLAHHVEALIANTRRHDETLQTSHVLQASLLPHQLPVVHGLSVRTCYEAASDGMDVGGDFYDVMVLPRGRVGFMIGDVAGHDRGAAALMGQLRSAARALAGQAGTPRELVGALHASWDALGFERIATAVFGELDPATGAVRLCSAGHYPPLVVRDGKADLLDVAPGSPLGAPRQVASQWDGILSPGEILVLYTDGAVDERRLGIDRGLDRLLRVVSEGSLDPSEVCDRVIAMLGPVRYDDVALLALRIDEPAGA
jgi:serine/threonine-protein kinase RsbW